MTASGVRTTMKLRPTIFLTLFVSLAEGILLMTSSQGLPDSSTNPEFYFTRLWYEEGGLRNRGGLFGFGRGTMPKPAPYHCPEFGGRNFFPPQGRGWATDYPGADCKFMGGI